MPDGLIGIDKKIFLALNHFAVPEVDPFMRFLSGPVPWIIFILGFLLVNWYIPENKKKVRFLMMLGSLIIAYAISEQTSVHLFKEVFMRLRPCHEPTLAGQVRLVVSHCGGQYGFVSTHSTNSFTLAILSALLIHRRWFTISVFSWAILVSYSRIYVGVHYPGDVLCGMILGLFIGTSVYFLALLILKNTTKKQ